MSVALPRPGLTPSRRAKNQPPPRALRALPRVVDAAVRAGPLHLGAEMATLAAVRRAAV